MLNKILSCVVFLFVSLPSFAQVIKFADPNFKKALIDKKIDVNNDGEIDIAEAKKISKLYLENVSFVSMEGIKVFSNLEEFGTYKTPIKTIDLQGMTSLKYVYLIGNDMESVNLNGCVNLEQLSLIGNKLKEVDLLEFKKLVKLRLSYNQLTRVEINNYTGLTDVDVSDNTISDFKISGCPKLSFLDINKNKIGGHLDLSRFPELKYFGANFNTISSVNIHGLAKLETFSCLYCSITTLNMSGAESLTDITW